jgi:hypothetical protein
MESVEVYCTVDFSACRGQGINLAGDSMEENSVHPQRESNRCLPGRISSFTDELLMAYTT